MTLRQLYHIKITKSMIAHKQKVVIKKCRGK